MSSTCLVHKLGLVAYEEAWQLQNRLAADIAAGRRPATLLLLEHPHTYTFGRSGKKENLLWGDDELSRRGISVHWVDRGGDVTYHGPGQLVGYPLLPLGTVHSKPKSQYDASQLPKADYIGYLRKLESTLISALKVFGVPSRRYPGLTGVWIAPSMSAKVNERSGEIQSPPEKIAAIGVKVDAQGISRHGFALNANPDMSYWEGIIGCGLNGYPETSLAKIMGNPPGMESLMEAVITAFGREFEYSMEIKPL
jgi:lipoyl(octanoyl) transferase